MTGLKRRFSSGCMAAALMVVTLVPTSLASASMVPAQSNIATTLAGFEGLVAKANTAKQVKLTDTQKEQRRQEVAMALNSLDPMDRAGYEKAARSLGVIVYNPNLDSVGIQSEVGDLATVYAPGKTYDSMLKEFAIYGTAQWMDATAIAEDAGHWSGPVGEDDVFGLVLTGWTAPLGDIDYHFYTYDKAGTMHVNSGNAATRDHADGRLALLYKGRESYLGSGSKVTDWWKMNAWFYYPASLEETVGGEVYMTYAHTWKEVQLQDFDFTLGPTAKVGTSGPEYSVGLGFTFKFSLTDKGFAIPGRMRTY